MLTVSRRSLLQGGSLALAGVAVGLPKSAIAGLLPPIGSRPPAAEVKSYGAGQNNLGQKLYGSGASAADFREAWVSLGTLSSTLQSNGFYGSVDSAMRSQSSAVYNFNPSSIDPYALLAGVRRFVPAMQLAAVDQAINQINASSKQSALSNGTASGVAQYISTLQQRESAIGGGLATVKYGIRHGLDPALRKAGYCPAGVTAGLFLLAAAFAPEVTLGVLFGVAITGVGFFGLCATVYTIAAAIEC